MTGFRSRRALDAVPLCAGLARAVATSPTLSHLALHDSSTVLAGIVANGLALRHVTHFEYFIYTTLPEYHRFEAVLPLLYLCSLVKLVLGGRLLTPRTSAASCPAATLVSS